MNIRKWGAMVATAAMVMIGGATATPAAQAQSVAPLASSSVPASTTFSGEMPDAFPRPLPAPAGALRANYTGVRVTCKEPGNRTPGAFGDPLGAAPCSQTVVSQNLLLQPGNLVCKVTFRVKTWLDGETQIQSVLVERSGTNDPRCDQIVLNGLPQAAWPDQICERTDTTPHTYKDAIRFSFTLGPTTVSGTTHAGLINPASVTGFNVGGPIVGAPGFTLTDVATVTPPIPTISVISVETPCKWKFDADPALAL